jgi:hypothetical protein
MISSLTFPNKISFKINLYLILQYIKHTNNTNDTNNVNVKTHEFQVYFTIGLRAIFQIGRSSLP